MIVCALDEGDTNIGVSVTGEKKDGGDGSVTRGEATAGGLKDKMT